MTVIVCGVGSKVGFFYYYFSDEKVAISKIHERSSIGAYVGISAANYDYLTQTLKITLNIDLNNYQLSYAFSRIFN